MPVNSIKVNLKPKIKFTGEVYKSASWKSPAKGVRFDMRSIENRNHMLEICDWSGGYLYAA